MERRLAYKANPSPVENQYIPIGIGWFQTRMTFYMIIISSSGQKRNGFLVANFAILQQE